MMHRLGLSETILVFPEHLGLAGGAPLATLVRRLRRNAPEKKLVIEVKVGGGGSPQRRRPT